MNVMVHYPDQDGRVSWTWSDDERRGETYNWHPRSDFRNAYGVSIGVDGYGAMWQPRPVGVRLRSFVCQRPAAVDWRRHLRLHLEWSAERTFTLILSDWTGPSSNWNPPLHNAVCYIEKYVRQFQKIHRYRASFFRFSSVLPTMRRSSFFNLFPLSISFFFNLKI